MKAKLYIPLAMLSLMFSCSTEPKGLHLHCYSLDLFDTKLLNTPYDVYLNEQSLLVKDGNDTIYHISIDSITGPEITSNEHRLTFENYELHYTNIGKFVSDNSVCSVRYEKTMITGTDTIIGYEFEDASFGRKYQCFRCKEPFSPEQYKEFINWLNSIKDTK